MDESGLVPVERTAIETGSSTSVDFYEAPDLGVIGFSPSVQGAHTCFSEYPCECQLVNGNIVCVKQMTPVTLYVLVDFAMPNKPTQCVGAAFLD